MEYRIPDFIMVCQRRLDPSAPETDAQERLHQIEWVSTRRKQVVSANAGKRAARLRQATPPWADLDAIALVYLERWRVTRETGVQHHVDHIVPLQGACVCGLHVHHNLRIIPALENIRKRNKLDEPPIVGHVA